MSWTMPAEPEDTAPPDAAARGILLAAMLSSVLWVGLALSVLVLW
ncbi:hypothetical protein [Dankookia sp. P2]